MFPTEQFNRTLEALKAAVDAVRPCIDITQVDSLQDKIFLTNRQKTSHELLQILNLRVDFAELFKNLKEFLSKQWDLIRLNLLSYTSLPEDDLTRILCIIAEIVAAAASELDPQRKYCALEFLMPTVALESISDEYPSLHELPLQFVLKNYIVGKNGSYLIPVRQLVDFQCAWPINAGETIHNVYFDYSDTQSCASLCEEEYRRLTSHSVYTEELLKARIDYEIIT